MKSNNQKKYLSVFLTLCLVITMFCACSGSSSSDSSGDVEEETIDMNETATYIDAGNFTVDAETLLQSIENSLSTTDAQLKYEREAGTADLFVMWPMDVDNDIENWIHFYKYDSDGFSQDISDSSSVPNGIEIQYDFYQKGDSLADSTDRATQATVLIMRAIGFTEEDMSDEDIYDFAFAALDRSLGFATMHDDGVGDYHDEMANVDIVSRAVIHNKNAKVTTLRIEPKISEGEIAQRDNITFGSYEQDNDTSNGKEPIEWIVLDEVDGKVLLLSKMALDNMQYLDGEHTSCTWCNSTVRNWLNGEFISEAFSDEEKNKICETNVVTDNNERYGTSGGDDSSDKVFLLSYQELFKYFPNSTTCQPTAYAIEHGSYVSSKDDEDKGNTYWFLRTPGIDQTAVLRVAPDGHAYGDTRVYEECSIRPAMWIEME